jgi:hypothetical protein
MEEIALYALHVDDDPSLNPWTFRTWLYVRSLFFLPKTFFFFRELPLYEQELTLL